MNRKHFLSVVGSCLISATLPLSAQAELEYSRPSIAYTAAKKLAETAQQACADAGFNTVTTVVDSYGLLKVALVADGSFPHAIETSLRKARTAASRGLPSGEVAGRNSHETALSDTFHAIGLTSLGGGLPIFSGQRLIGGIAIAGAPGENAAGQDYDLLCLQQGLAALELKDVPAKAD